jgi:phosphopantothenate-cysteine ligase/phosphopantothenoylcysteine decarboxylase/phosphopantothenate--cysteine ligase
MRIFVTAGNTQTPIDRVRCITNIFTGRTGAAIAAEAHRRGHHVAIATSRPEVTAPILSERWSCVSYRTFDELAALMAAHVPNSEVVIHCAAVSDYHAAGIYAPAPGTTFDGPRWTGDAMMLDRSAGKVKSDAPELWLRLVRAPKLVDKIRTDWSFRGFLVKFKLEVGITEDALQLVAEKSRQQSSANWMVANTLEGSADWALIGNAAGYRKVVRADLPRTLFDVIEKEAAGA